MPTRRLPVPAFRYRWSRPDGMARYILRWSVKRSTHQDLWDGVAGALPKPYAVIAPAKLANAAWELLEPQPKALGELVRAVEILDTGDEDALCEFLSKWGFLRGKPASYGRLRVPHELAPCFEAPDSTPHTRAPRIPNQADAVPYVHVNSAQTAVRTYQRTVQRYAELSKLRGEDRRQEEGRLHPILLEQLARYGGSERDPETFLPLIASPLGAAWQNLAERYAEAILPVLCAGCSKAITPLATDLRRHASPPRYCSKRCHLKTWRAKNASQQKTRRRPARRGRK